MAFLSRSGNLDYESVMVVGDNWQLIISSARLDELAKVRLTRSTTSGHIRWTNNRGPVKAICSLRRSTLASGPSSGCSAAVP